METMTAEEPEESEESENPGLSDPVVQRLEAAGAPQHEQIDGN